MFKYLMFINLYFNWEKTIILFKFVCGNSSGHVTTHPLTSNVLGLLEFVIFAKPLSAESDISRYV